MYDVTNLALPEGDLQVGSNVPKPSGYKILVKPLQVEKQTTGGIWRPDELIDRESAAAVVAFVIAIGPDAYSDQSKFPTGPWCKEGDFVIMRPYSGTRLKIFEHELRLVNDDSIEAVIDDPRGVKRA